MDRMVYTALSGMRSAMVAQDVTANNLANASTVGFRRDIGDTRALGLAGGSFASRFQASEEVLAAGMEAGTLTTTGRDLDVAVGGSAMLSVQSRDGSEAYTRRGDLRLSPTGLLETGDGLPVLGNGGPISLPPADKIVIGADGTISIRPEGSLDAELIAVDRLKLVSPDIAGLKKGADNLFRMADGSVAPVDLAAKVDPGHLEQSNVNSMAAMVELIEQSRGYELQVQMLTAARDLDQSSTALLRLDA